jgi:hypothetical protein
MSSNQDISIIGCWIEPHSNITYLEKSQFKVELQNNSNNIIEIVEIKCQFQAEDGLSPKDFTLKPMMPIQPRNLEFFRIPFDVNLSLRQGTNYSVLMVKYRHKGEIKEKSLTFTYPDTTYIIIGPKHSPEKQFFISHKDPQQTTIATKLDDCLIKIGYRGYVAENDKRPGTDLWEEKIIPSINNCVNLIVLWTSDAAKDPEQIIKEVKHTKTKNKRIIVLREKDVPLHEIFKGTVEYAVAQSKIDESEIVKLVEYIEKEHEAGRFSSS